jgi:hypothetical protein
MALFDAVARFAEEFNNEEKNFGTIVIRSEERAVLDYFLIDSELREFYAKAEFDELIIGNNFFLEIAALNQIARFQEGWEGMDHIKLVSDKDDKSWIVFGDRNGDAIFSKSEDVKSPVFGSIQQVDEFQLSSSLESFLDILTKCLIMERDEFGYETKLEDYTVKSNFIERIRMIVQEYETAKIANDFVGFFFE